MDSNGSDKDRFAGLSNKSYQPQCRSFEGPIIIKTKKSVPQQITGRISSYKDKNPRVFYITDGGMRLNWNRLRQSYLNNSGDMQANRIARTTNVCIPYDNE